MPLGDEQDICILLPSNRNADYYMPAPERFKGAAATATFQVDYVNAQASQTWTAEAMAAFDYALDIWSTYISSSIPIKIQANWIGLSEANVLASASTSFFVQINAGKPNTWYNMAQAAAISGLDVVNELKLQGHDVEHDIIINVNANFSRWHFGTNAAPTPGKIDFVTVMLHEIGHGLGFMGSVQANASSQQASLGFNDNPTIYDVFVVDGFAQSIVDPLYYQNNPVQLYNAATGQESGLHFWGDITLANNSGLPAKLYTPSEWNPGSSYSHLDQQRFSNTPNALMRPMVDFNYAMHSPGPVVCAMFFDMGWPLGSACTDVIQTEAIESTITVSASNIDMGITNVASPQKSLITLNNTDADNLLAGRVEIKNGNAFSILGDVGIYKVNPGQSLNVNIQYNPLSSGKHQAELHVYHNGTNTASPIIIPITGEALERDQVVKLEQGYPNPFTDAVTIPFTLPKTSNVTLEVYDVLGKHVQTLISGEQPSGHYYQTLRSDGLAGGVYFYILTVEGERKSGKLFLIR